MGQSEEFIMEEDGIQIIGPQLESGEKVNPPSWLDWELWQGPAPRKDFKDNLIHYNWHWHWHWGTGEALNNGTHMNYDLSKMGNEC